MSQLARNVLSVYAARTVSVGVGLALFPFITHHVGLGAYGVWLLVSSVTTFLLQADFGMGTSAIRFVSRARAQGDSERANAVLSSTVAFFAGLGLVAAALFCGFFAISWGSLDIPAGDRDTAIVMIAVVAVTHLAVGLPLGVFRQVLVSVHRMDVANRIFLFQALLRLALIVPTLLLGGGILGVVIAEAVVVLVTGVWGLFSAKRHMPEMRASVRLADLATLKEMAPYSAQVFVIGLAALGILYTDNAIIGLFLPIAAVTLYSAAFRVYWVLREVTTGLMNALVPDASAAQAVGDTERLRSLMLHGTKYGNLVVLAAAVPLLAFVEPLLVIWVGERFAEVAVTAQILIAGLLVNNNHLTSVGLMTGLGRLGAFTRYHVLWAVGNLAIGIALVPVIGLPAVALGTLIPLVLLEPLYIRVAVRELDLDPWTFIRESVVRPYAAAGLATVPLVAVAVAARPSDLGTIAAATATFLVAFGASAWQIALDDSERGRIERALGRFRSQRAPRQGPIPDPGT